MVWVWSMLVVLAGAFLTSASYLPASEGGPIGVPDVLLREMVARMGSGLAHPPDSFLPLTSHRLEEDEVERGVEMKKLQESLPLEYDEIALSPSLRDQEYLAHSTLLGSVLGNYEEKIKQHTKPIQGEGKDSTNTNPNPNPNSDGDSSSSSTSNTDGVLPAYCNPPNPCPIGYTAEDGCLEVFENTAAFSRDYQALQDCMCDTEHMFECDDSSQNSEITALARSIQNEGVLDSTLDKIMSDLTEEERQRHLVAKKFHQQKSVNPYLLGEKLPVAAKKGGMM